MFFCIFNVLSHSCILCRAQKRWDHFLCFSVLQLGCLRESFFPIASTNRKKTSPSTYRFPRELFFFLFFFFTKALMKVVSLLLNQTAYIRIRNSRRLKRESLVIIRKCGLFLSFSFSPSFFSSPRPSGFIPFFLFCFPMGTFCALTLVPSSSRDAHNGALH